MGETGMEDEVTALMSSDSLTGVGPTAVEAIPERFRGADGPGAAPPGASIGRYLVIDLLGTGGMGVVYRAYDPKLQREVALKCLRSDVLSQETRARMLREAQSMAKLSHPNVVAVFDVEEEERQVTVAMEYVQGQTLRSYIRADTRPWREVVGLFLEAGRGLAAAHAAGILHRDFKPANVLLGEDGRPRVTDFGLARFRTGNDSSHSTSSRSIDADLVAQADGLTQLGQVMGTPAYMAPEQHSATELGPAADQYAFCVSLWQALTGERPFDADSFHLLVKAKCKGPPAWPRRVYVPGPIVDAVRRGLAPAPQDRWPGMNDLLEALRFDPDQVRRRWAWRLGVIALVGVTGLAVAGWQRSRSALCNTAADQLGPVWNDAQRQRLSAAIEHTGVEYAEGTWARVEAGLDDFADAWTGMRTEACEATAIDGGQSGTVMDLRMACLDRATVELAAAIEVLARADRETLDKVDDIVAGLPSIERCADVEALQAAVPPPEDPVTAREVDTLRAQVAEARALVDAGAYDDAVELAQTVTEVAQRIEYPPIRTEALLARAEALRFAADYRGAEADYRAGLILALEWGQWPEALDAAQGLTHLLGPLLARYDEAEAFADMAIGFTARRQFGAKARADTLSVIATLRESQGRLAEAEQMHREALQLRIESSGTADHRSVAVARANLAGVLFELGRYEESEREYAAVVETRETRLGPRHPEFASAKNALASLLIDMGRYDEAETMLEDALEIRTAAMGERHPTVAATRNNLATLYGARGDYAGALEQYDLALSIYEERFGPDHPDPAMVRANKGAALYTQGRYAEAEQEYRRALEIRERHLGVAHPHVADSRNNLANTLYALERHDEAAQAYRDVIRSLEQSRGPTHPSLGYPYSNLGLALLAQGDHEEAERQIRRSLEIREASLGPDHAETAVSRNNLGLLLRQRGDLEAALVELRQAAAIYEKALGADHPDVGTAHANLGDGLLELGRTADAEQEYRTALSVVEPALGKDHVRTAVAYAGLGRAAHARGDDSQARAWHEKAWAALSPKKTFKMERARVAFELAEMIAERAGGRQRAIALAQEAYATYDALQGEEGPLRQEVARWLGRHGAPPSTRRPAPVSPQ